MTEIPHSDLQDTNSSHNPETLPQKEFDQAYKLTLSMDEQILGPSEEKGKYNSRYKVLKSEDGKLSIELELSQRRGEVKWIPDGLLHIAARSTNKELKDAKLVVTYIELRTDKQDCIHLTEQRTFEGIPNPTGTPNPKYDDFSATGVTFGYKQLMEKGMSPQSDFEIRVLKPK